MATLTIRQLDEKTKTRLRVRAAHHGRSMEEEILLGIELLPQGKRRQGLLRAAEDMFNEDLGGRVLGFESEAARPFAQIAAHRHSLGKPISHADAQIAAIARLRGAQVATRNVADFSDCGIDLVNPWDGGSA